MTRSDQVIAVMRFDYLVCRALSSEKLKLHAKLFEENGGDSISFDEDYLFEDTFSRAGFVAATTNNVGLHVMVNPYTRHPALTAMSALTLDRISKGRTRLVVGRSVSIWMNGWFGYEYSTPQMDLRRYVGALSKLMSGEVVNCDSKHFILRNVALSMKPLRSHIPILLAAMGPKTITLAAKISDGVLLNMYTSPTYARWAAQLVMDNKSRLTDFEFGCQIKMVITDNMQAEIQSSKRDIALLLSVPMFGELLLDRSGFETSILEPIRQELKVSERLQNNIDHLQACDAKEASRAASLVPDEVAEEFTVIGPVSKCRDKLAEYSKAGVNLASIFTTEEGFPEVAKHLEDFRG
jgi:alkanesulfonate monooxygenase SsuD/methylene tetrahydromethanopterin reductase-like flavin-dependent oxidoreductase (luciferase family)